MSTTWAVSVVPWPTYSDATMEPFWTVHIERTSGHRGPSRMNLTWAQRKGAWVQNSELGRAILHASAAVTEAKKVIVRAVGVRP